MTITIPYSEFIFKFKYPSQEKSVDGTQLDGLCYHPQQGGCDGSRQFILETLHLDDGRSAGHGSIHLPSSGSGLWHRHLLLHELVHRDKPHSGAWACDGMPQHSALHTPAALGPEDDRSRNTRQRHSPLPKGRSLQELGVTSHQDAGDAEETLRGASPAPDASTRKAAAVRHGSRQP